MDHTADSFNDICNMVELAGGGTVECCVNGSNNKMHCNTKNNLDNFLTSFMIDTSRNGECDRRSEGTPPVINICSDDFVNNSGK